MKYTCVQRPQCNHYPHTEIEAGEAEWVRVPLEGSWALQSRHKDCLSGLYYVASGGERVSPYSTEKVGAESWMAAYPSDGLTVEQTE